MSNQLLTCCRHQIKNYFFVLSAEHDSNVNDTTDIKPLLIGPADLCCPDRALRLTEAAP